MSANSSLYSFFNADRFHRIPKYHLFFTEVRKDIHEEVSAQKHSHKNIKIIHCYSYTSIQT